MFFSQNSILYIILFLILVLNICLLVVIFKNQNRDNQSNIRQFMEDSAKNTQIFVESAQNLNERMIRVETTIDRVTKGVDEGFRENRKEISTNLQTIQKTVDSRVKDLQTDNAKKLEEKKWEKNTIIKNLDSSLICMGPKLTFTLLPSGPEPKKAKANINRIETSIHR
mgnify:CR=1 FL=1